MRRLERESDRKLRTVHAYIRMCMRMFVHTYVCIWNCGKCFKVRLWEADPCIRMYILTYVRIYVGVSIMQKCAVSLVSLMIYVSVHIRTYANTHLSMYVCTTYVRTYVCVYDRTTGTYTCTCTVHCVGTYVHIVKRSVCVWSF